MSREKGLEELLMAAKTAIDGLRELLFVVADVASKDVDVADERELRERLAVIATHIYGALDSTKPKEPEPPKLRLVDPDDDE